MSIFSIACSYASPNLITTVCQVQEEDPGVNRVGEFRCWKLQKITNLPALPFTIFCGAVVVSPCIYSRSNVSFTNVAMKITKG
jgi:hypothetical protein